MASELRDYSLVTADAGYHSERGLKALAESNVAALIADNGMRKRDERFKDQGEHKKKPDPLHSKTRSAKKAKHYRPADFATMPRPAPACACWQSALSERSQLQAQRLSRREVPGRSARLRTLVTGGRNACARQKQPRRGQVCFFRGKASAVAESFTDRMKRAIDSPRGRELYVAASPPSNRCSATSDTNKGLNRFTLRGRTKVDAQWKLYCLVHNIEKLAHHGFGSRPTGHNSNLPVRICALDDSAPSTPLSKMKMAR